MILPNVAPYKGLSQKRSVQAVVFDYGNVLCLEQTLGLAEVRTIQVESWLRGLPLAKSSCANIRNLMSVLFDHACRYELFNRNPIYLVRQSAKHRTPPGILMPAEIKALIGGLALREPTLVLHAASTG